MHALDFDDVEEAEEQQRSPPEGFRHAASRDALAWWEETARAFLTAARAWGTCMITSSLR